MFITAGPIIKLCSGARVGISIGITVTADHAGPEFCGGRVEGVDRFRFVPVGAFESSLFENLLRLHTMAIEVTSKDANP